jgi:hypothetical protein
MTSGVSIVRHLIPAGQKGMAGRLSRIKLHGSAARLGSE